MKKILAFSKKNKEVLTLMVVLLISGVFHAWNMFHYPFFENDEGTYMAQAWSFLTHGELAPYTYWYDHAPLGWIFTSVWIFLTGGLFTFGFSLYSARIFMLLIHIFSTFFLFKITKTITKSDLASFIIGVFFSLSPLAIYFQRRLLLDNLMVFWVLFSLYLIFYAKHRLLFFILSSFSFGIAVLTKENAIFFLPIFVWLVFKESHTHHRIFAVTKWIVIAGMIISLYPLYALLKGELFPVGSIFSSNEPHVSLLETLKMQSGRGTGLPFWNGESDFILNVKYWYGKDPLIILLGFVTLVVQCLQVIFNQKSKIIVLLTLPMLLFLMSGKLVINFYIVPLVPFIAMCIGYTLFQLLELAKKINISLFYLGLALMMTLIGHYYYHHIQEPLTRDETSKQVEAINWIKQNISPESRMAIDFYGYLDLSESRFLSDPSFPNADWFWKVELDPEIKIEELDGNPANLDYVMVTAEVQRQLKGFPEESSMLRGALRDSTYVKDFSLDKNFNFTLDLFNQNYPNGDWVVLYKQNTSEDTLKLTWNTYINNFSSNAGKTVDAYANRTTSEGQSYALLRSVWLGDKETFDRALLWTKNNLLLKNKNLFAWWYGKDSKGNEGIVDAGAATDADQDIALALLLASKRWDKNEYRIFAEQIISDIWKYETVEVKGKRYIVAGDWASDTKNTEFTINPSYLSPYAYRIFAEVDREHDWMSVVDTSYEVLDKCSSSELGISNATYLPPDWCNITMNGAIVVAENMSKNSANYSYDALRIPWRIGLDYVWNKEERAKEYLKKITLFSDEWNENKKIHSSYTHAGKAIDDTEALSQYAGQLAYFTIVDKEVAEDIYDSKILPNLRNNVGKHYWGDLNNYYDQNWVWFSTALYKNRLPNLWTAN